MMNITHKALLGTFILATAAGCATAPERPRGAIQPMEGGRYQSAVKAEDKARDDEILRLKDELAKANAELERIKRRLAPRP